MPAQDLNVGMPHIALKIIRITQLVLGITLLGLFASKPYYYPRASLPGGVSGFGLFSVCFLCDGI